MWDSKSEVFKVKFKIMQNIILPKKKKIISHILNLELGVRLQLYQFYQK